MTINSVKMKKKVKQKESKQQSKSITLTQFETDHITEVNFKIGKNFRNLSEKF